MHFVAYSWAMACGTRHPVGCTLLHTVGQWLVAPDILLDALCCIQLGNGLWHQTSCWMHFVAYSWAMACGTRHPVGCTLLHTVGQWLVAPDILLDALCCIQLGNGLWHQTSCWMHFVAYSWAMACGTRHPVGCTLLHTVGQWLVALDILLDALCCIQLGNGLWHQTSCWMHFVAYSWAMACGTRHPVGCTLLHTVGQWLVAPDILLDALCCIQLGNGLWH